MKSNRNCLLLIFFFSISFTANSQESLFPQIPGWKLAQDDPVYDANNLWDAIDGAADLYLEYAFSDLHIGRYINSDSLEIKVEIYRHNSEVDAFGIYSQERDPVYNFIQIGIQGYLQSGVLNFLTGPYYIKLSTYQTGEKAQQALQMIGQQLNAYLQQNNTPPKILQYFPQKRKQQNTEQYIARNFLGYNFLSNVYTASYLDGISFKIFILEAKSEDDAKATLAKYLNIISKEGIKRIDPDRYLIHDPHNGIIELQTSQKYIFGILNCSVAETRDRYIKEVAANLSN
jgi:hypothetical protein